MFDPNALASIYTGRLLRAKARRGDNYFVLTILFEDSENGSYKEVVLRVRPDIFLELHNSMTYAKA